MAEGGHLHESDFIEDEKSYEESDDAPDKELTFEGEEAAKMFHFFQKTDLRTMAADFKCQVTRSPPDGLAKTLKIRFKQNCAKDIKIHIVKMRLEMKNLDTKLYTFNRDKSRKLSEYLSSPDRSEDSVCYIPDIAQNTVEIVGKSYDDTWKAEHKLKVYLGEIKTTGTSRLGRQMGRQMSDPGESSAMDVIKPSSFSGMYPENKSTAAIKNEKFARSCSGPGFSRHGLPSADDFLFETKLKNNFVLKVYKASITNLSVEVIVNAANDIMMHGGGVARVISRAAGRKLDEESIDYVKRHGNLKVTENIVTTAGNLTQYKAVIHAVGPIWHDYRNKTDCLDALGDCVYNILEKCSKNKFRTVAMPAISAGIYAVPKELCADMYVEAAARFSKHLQPGDCPRELHIVDIDTSILKFVEVSARKWQKDPQSLNARVTVPKFLEANPHLAGHSRSNQEGSSRPHRGYRGQGHGGGGQRSDQGQMGGRDFGGSQRHTGQTSNSNVTIQNKYNLSTKLKRKEEETFGWGGKAQVFEIGDKITVKIFKGEVSKTQNMDAVVCCIDKNFIASGSVAGALRIAGGKDYEKNFQNMERKNRTFAKKGSVFKCKAGSLSVHHVIHVVMDRIADATPREMEIYSGHIYMILNKADEWKYSKLVIPLFGTGFVQLVPDKIKSCCVAVLKGIDDYVKDSLGKGKVTDIHLVNKDDIVCKTLMKVFDEGVNTPSSYGNSSNPASSRVYSDGKSVENRNIRQSLKRQDRKRSPVSNDRHDRHEERKQFGNTARGKISAKDRDEGNNVSDDRYDMYGGREKFESSGRERVSARKGQDKGSTSGRYQHGATANAPYTEVSEGDSGDDSDGDTGNRQSVPPEQEQKQTGNLMIIEN